MNCEICTITFRNGGWYVEKNKMSLRPYLLKSLALQVTIATALNFYRKGARTKLRIEDPSLATVEHCICPDQNRGAPCIAS